MPCPKTKGFSAWINVMPGAAQDLTVSGQVETGSGTLLPQLTERVPQGINPEILLLDLTIVESGQTGLPVVGFREAIFRRPASKGQFTQVEILCKDDTCVSIKVTEAT